MKPIFGSLGSNYTWSDAALVLRSAVFSKNTTTETTLLKQALEKYFPEHDTHAYFLQGRQAIEVALRAYGIGAGDGVITQGFSCFAVADAIRKTGATAVLADVAPDSTNMGLSEITAAAKTASVPIKAVILQHSLGVVADEAAVREWCDRHKVLLFSDLAQGFGSRHPDGTWIGSTADCVILSFGRDKILDAVLGGAALFRTPVQNSVVLKPFTELSQQHQLRPALYPLLTCSVRATWQFSLGKVLLKLAQLLGLTASPVLDASAQPQQLPTAHAELVRTQLARLEEQLAHRQNIAHIYVQHLAKSAPLTSNQFRDSALVRFPVCVPNPPQLLQKLTTHGIYLTDRWYTKPLDAGTLKLQRAYEKHSCPRTELLCEQIINLPTHRAVTQEAAEQIAVLVAKELKEPDA